MLRFLDRLYAHLFGYFWLPCPMCTEYFGGHEWSNASVKTPDCSEGIRTGVCQRCAVIVQRHNKGLFSMGYGEVTNAAPLLWGR